MLNLNGTANDLTLDFAWNPASQLHSMTRSNDAYAFTGLSNGSIAETVNGLNQVTNSGGSTAIHDERGNLTELGGQSFTYTTDNQLAGASGTAFLSYDPLGRLLQIETAQNRHFDHAGETIISEIDGNNGAILRRFVPGPDIDEPLLWYEGSGTGDRRWLHADERGSVVAVTDGGGSVIGSLNRYDDYGNPQGVLNGRFGFTGQAWLPEVGLYYYRARMYIPNLGRFMQTDLIGYDDGMNLYAYVGNDPINRADPFGLQGNQSECGEEECPIVVTADRIPIPSPASVRVTSLSPRDFLALVDPGWLVLTRELLEKLSCSVSPESLDNYLQSKSSPMTGTGADLMDVGEMFDIDPRLIVAIAGAESGFGRNITWGQYNAWNWGWNVRNRSNSPFSSWRSGMTNVARGLSRNYDLTSTSTMYSQYCVGADCANGLANVNTFMREQGANPNSLTHPCRREE